MLSAPLLSEDFDQFLQQEMGKELLRFTTAGSVDDGKSTLIGRLLHDAKGVYEDQLASVKKSRINRSTGPIDFSLLTDGLRAEREQGITIDVAYRYFATPRRKFIIADTPGHEQYTRNMATGASTANLAVILVDATKGLLPQTRRHSYIASLLGIPNVLAAINKMDLVGHREDIYLRLQADFLALARHLDIPVAQCVPISALEGDNIVARSRNMPWYSGPTLLEHLETVAIQPSSSIDAIRFPVQYVIRPDSTFRGFAGHVAGGAIHTGDSLLALPSGQTTRVRSIVTYDGKLAAAVRSQSVTLELEDEIDLSRGDMLVSPDAPPKASRTFSAMVVWLNEKPLDLHRTYLAKHTTRQVKTQITRIQNRVDVNTLTSVPATELEMNGIALLHLETNNPLFIDSYRQSRATGSFILIDPLTNATVAAGMIGEDLSKRETVVRIGREQEQLAAGREAVTPQERFKRHGHLPAIFLLPNRDFLAESAERALFDNGFETISVDGDQIPSASVKSVLNPLWSAGLVVLFAAGNIPVETHRILETFAEDSLFDFVTAEPPLTHRDLASRILSQAASLRLSQHSSTSGRED
jgi:bifunctional enzyme CysN/CysC/sulfate adenylyltransferase subunit 1